MDGRKESILAVVLRALLGYLVKYFAHGFLTGAVLLTFAAFMVAYLTIWGSDVSFLQYFSSVIPLDPNGNATLGVDDVMRVYSLLTLILMLLSLAVGALRRVFRSKGEKALIGEDKPASQALRVGLRRIRTTFVVISVTYLIVFVVLPFADLAAGESLVAMYLMFALFYLLAIASGAIYVVVDGLADLVLSGVRPERLGLPKVG